MSRNGAAKRATARPRGKKEKAPEHFVISVDLGTRLANILANLPAGEVAGTYLELQGSPSLERFLSDRAAAAKAAEK
ncbi:MAG: hypothetical protein ACR2O6_00715 [Ilumatobacteraceae bacterium]